MRKLHVANIVVLVGVLGFPLYTWAGDLDLCKELSSRSVAACQKLADRDDPAGLFGLGSLYLEGIGVQKDINKSFQLMYRSAMLGNAYAQYQVGEFYVNGQGVKRDVEEGYAWVLVSRENKNPIAQQGIEFLDKNKAIKPERLKYVTQRANELYAKTLNKRGFAFDPEKSQVPVSSVAEYCDLVMPTVDTIIQIRKWQKPRSTAHQLMVGMTDERAIKMMNGVIEWVWTRPLRPEQMHDDFKAKCLAQSPELAFMF
jgi:hypothetical protein